MGTIALQVPVPGQPNSTEAAKVDSNFVTLQAWANGNVDDATNLASPNNGVRRLLLSSSGIIGGGVTGGDYLFSLNGFAVPNTGNSSQAIPMWNPDAGYSGQPTDFQVASKTAFGRIRVTANVNATGPGVTLTFGMYQLATLGGGTNVITYTVTLVAGTTVAQASPSATVAYMLETPQFVLPLSGNPMMLGVALSGQTAAASVCSCTMQLYGYNA